jgi:hypothetical protein
VIAAGASLGSSTGGVGPAGLGEDLQAHVAALLGPLVAAIAIGSHGLGFDVFTGAPIR